MTLPIVLSIVALVVSFVSLAVALSVVGMIRRLRAEIQEERELNTRQMKDVREAVAQIVAKTYTPGDFDKFGTINPY